MDDSVRAAELHARIASTFFCELLKQPGVDTVSACSLTTGYMSTVLQIAALLRAQPQPSREAH